MAADPKGLVAYIARGLVDAPHEVVVSQEQDAAVGTVLKLQVAPDDRGKVIGKKGRVAHTMRTLLRASASPRAEAPSLEIID